MNSPENIGLNGCIKDTGFMVDGSYYYGNIYRKRVNGSSYREDFTDALDRVRNGTRGFNFGEHMDPEMADRLEELLRYCQENDICIIGFLTPFSSEVFSAMVESGNFGYMMEVGPVCEEMLSRYGFELYNYLDVSNMASNEFFLDGYHGRRLCICAYSNG